MLSAIAILPGIYLTNLYAPAGMLWLLIGSFLLMLRTYRREWRLNPLMALLPPLTTGLSYAAQLYFNKISLNVTWLAIAAGIGLLVGIFRGRAHSIYFKGSHIFAKRTSLYLVIWLIVYIITQTFALARQRGLAEFGSLGGAFSTAMLSSVMFVLLIRYTRASKKLGGVAA